MVRNVQDERFTSEAAESSATSGRYCRGKSDRRDAARRCGQSQAIGSKKAVTLLPKLHPQM